MEQSFSYTRDNIPPLPPITEEMNPQIPYNYPAPFKGPEPQKMAPVDPDLRFDSPEEWWNVPRGNFPGESLPKTAEYFAAQAAPPTRENYHRGKPRPRPYLGAIVLLLVIISFILIS
jgi:hypothetical protein